MIHIQKPWLIARGNLGDSTIRYDYMGAAEFEFGAIPASFRRLFGEELATHEVKIHAPNGKELTVFIVSRASFLIAEYEPFFQQLAENNLRLKEWTNFDKAVKATAGIEKPKWKIADVWHDIDNDIIFTMESKEVLESTIQSIRAAHAELDTKRTT